MSHLNYFEPYERAKGRHLENDLTRAFLALLDLVPMAMAEFLDQLRDRLPAAAYEGEALLPRLSQVSEPIDVVTQKGAEAVDTEREWLVSVLMTDEHLPIEKGLQPRGKGAIYDGVVTVGDHVVTLENKLHREDVRMEQLNPDLPGDRTIRWPDDARAVVVPWREMIKALVNLRDQGRLNPTASALVGQFQGYVLTHFDYLNPYPTLAACHDSELLLNRRCGQILQALGGEELLHEHSSGRFFLRLPGSKVPVRRFFLGAGLCEAGEVTHITGGVWPGDLVTQARPFYGQLDRDGLIALQENEAPWDVAPNLHLSYRGDHLIYSSSERTLEPYLDYWLDRRHMIRRVEGAAEMRNMVYQLYEDGWLADEDLEAFEQKFELTNRNYVDVCPGVRIETEWPIEEARRLDDGEGQFVEEVRERFEAVLGLWGQQLPAGGES